MAIATGTALAIGLGASAAAGVASAKIGSNAAKKAAAQQTASADRAMGLMDRAYAPYQQAGSAAMGMLGRLVAPTAGTRYASPDPMQKNYEGMPAPGVAGATGSVGGRNPQPPQFMAPGQQPPMRGAGPVPRAHASSMDSMVGQTIRLQSPDGEVRDVPAYMADRFLQAGARRIR